MKLIFLVVSVMCFFGCSFASKKTCEKETVSKCLSTFEEASLSDCIDFSKAVCKKVK